MLSFFYARSSLASLFFLFLTLFRGQAANATDFTFIDAWQHLQTHSDTLIAQQEAVKRQQYLQKAATMHHLPSISINGGYTHLSEPLSVDGSKMEPFASMDTKKLGVGLLQLTQSGQISPQFAHDIGALLKNIGTGMNTTTEISNQDIFTSSLTAVWPLFTGWRIQAADEIATQQTEESKAQLAILQKRQFTTLARVYFGVVLAKKVLETRIEAENGLKIHHQHALALEEEGQIARVERLKAEAAYDRAKVATGKARRMLEVAEAALTKMLQQEEHVSPTSPLFINANLPREETFRQQTLQTYPGLMLLKAKQEQAKGLIKVEKGRYFPQLFAMGTYNLYKDDSIIGESTPDWFAGLGASMTLFDNQGRSEKVQAARAALAQVSHLYTQAERDLSILVEKTWRETVQAEEEFCGLQSSLALAEENVRLREKGFSQGVFTSLDVVDARLFLESIKTQRHAASFTYVVSLAQLLALSGEIEEFNLYQKN